MIGYSRPATHLQYDPTLEIARLNRAAPRPTSLNQTGLSLNLLGDLLCKHLSTTGVMVLSEIVSRIGLTGPVVEQILQYLRSEALVELRTRSGMEGEMRYGLTERGRSAAFDALMRSGYLGPAPVPLEDYCDLVQHQSIKKRRIERDMLMRALSGAVVDPALCDQLGPAINSGRSIFLYGTPGTGKTFISQRLARVLPDLILVPYAIAVGDTVVELFDPQIHVQVSLNTPTHSLQLGQGWDARYACCQRPVVTAAGELTLEMLEVQRDPVARTCNAPLQLKANNGVFLIDDLGRQRVQARSLFDRWIVPMEEGRDFLSAGSGQHFAVPFDQILLFSTNLDPAELADSAFLRRVGYKIQLHPCSPEVYRDIWQRVCKEREVFCDPAVILHAIRDLHSRSGIALLPCHPRDLIGMALDWKVYRGEPLELDEAGIDWAWNNYFLTNDIRRTAAKAPSTAGA